MDKTVTDHQSLIIKYLLLLDKDQLHTMSFKLEFLYNLTQLTILQLASTIHSLYKAETNSDYQLQAQLLPFRLHTFLQYLLLQLQSLLITMFKLPGQHHSMVAQLSPDIASSFYSLTVLFSLNS